MCTCMFSYLCFTMCFNDNIVRGRWALLAECFYKEWATQYVHYVFILKASFP